MDSTLAQLLDVIFAQSQRIKELEALVRPIEPPTPNGTAPMPVGPAGMPAKETP